ncbi:phosphate signaling complex protein PhoU [Dissulfurirhabdus thermomarina]|uniref:Phosphate-specific transport system accessory protein PhoU n=1 Tax=Dissulfurirhabdus thermomarina TaxID=1765737 RepID=A0A6N9TM79_DISTH|nr:phosphate signaling complex protein PhoU [Dissulfurirhabdus thermomarina]NDY42382.1 phosphate signaling complex protein PhoU [Dissulfurirhabdus thermomarina]NMX24316.1 phosphate signaling complex protein PhoU [Dissulfurirhabdus thermomarina]
MSKHLQRDIENLKKQLLAMSAVVEESVHKATQAVMERNAPMAEEVIQGDIEVDQMEVDIEEECLKLLALYQPVAIDLRFIIAVLKINSDLERVGDLAVNIAERAAFLATQERICMPFDFEGMAEKAQGMLSRSIDALVNLDVRLAHRVRAEDDDVDAMNREMYAVMKEELARHPDRVNCLIHMLSIGRHLERIADHATNIAEDVVYLVEAEIVRHTPEVFKE